MKNETKFQNRYRMSLCRLHHHPYSNPPVYLNPFYQLMAGFRSIVTKKINAIHNTPGEKIW